LQLDLEIQQRKKYQMDEKQFLDKQLVVGQTSLNEEGNVQVQIIKQGKITSATNGSLVIQDLNGQSQIPVSEVDLFIKVPRGEYGIDPNGQMVKNPDFLLVQPGKLSATTTNAGSDGLWKTQEKRAVASRRLCLMRCRQ
jgi:hypothetical protein